MDPDVFYIDGMPYGLEIPALNDIRDGKAFWEEVIRQRPLIERVAAFLVKNGAINQNVTEPEGKPFYYMLGVLNGLDNPHPASGMRFYGSEELAQKVANAFPHHRVMTEDGTVMAPKKAPKPKGPKL